MYRRLLTHRRLLSHGRALAHRGGTVCLAVAIWLAGMMGHALAAPPLQQDQQVYVVQAGDTLFAIAQQYGVLMEAIAAANGLSNPNRLAVGQQLIIPGASSTGAPIVYVVQPGDALALVARRYNVAVLAVAQTNRLANPNLIYVGQRLLIPARSEESGTRFSGRIHVVQPGDTMANIAARYGTTVWAVAQANGLDNPNMIQMGQRLFIPLGEGQSSLPLPFLAVNIVPPVAAQGQTVQVLVQTEGEVSLSGSYDGKPLLFVGGEGRYRTLIGIHPMASPGSYPLDLKAVQGEQPMSVHSMVQVVPGSFGVEYLTFSGEKAKLLEPSLLAAEARRVGEVATQVTLPGLWEAPFKLPLAGAAPITASFGARRSYGAGPADDYHSGIDYDAPEGAPVHSPARGRVVLAEPLAVRGNAVIVDHGRGVMTAYWHLSRIDVQVGQQVETGERLGLVGNTGLSTGAHLHWELRIMGVQVDPLQWVHENIE